MCAMRQFIRFSRVIAAVALVMALVIGCQDGESALRYASGVVLAMSGLALLLALRAAERMQDGEEITE